MPLSMPQCDEHIRSEHSYAHREKDVPRPKQQRAYYQCKNRVPPLKPAEEYLEERRTKRHIERVLGEVAAKDAQPVAHRTVAQRFHELANEWETETSHISSVSDLVAYPPYQEIIRLGWDVVPYLLADLQKKKRFWFPALAAITNIRPFDAADAGNARRMTEAWVRWGKRKGLI